MQTRIIADHQRQALIFVFLFLACLTCALAQEAPPHLGQKRLASLNHIELWYDVQPWHGENNRYQIFNESGRTAHIFYTGGGITQNMWLAPGESRPCENMGHSVPQITDVEFAHW
jgi:hypothetical protein